MRINCIANSKLQVPNETNDCITSSDIAFTFIFVINTPHHKMNACKSVDHVTRTALIPT